MTLNKIIDLILDRIMTFSDYYLVKKHVTLSESAIFLLSLTRAIWFSIFGVRDIYYDMLWSDGIWVIIYTTITLLHFGTFFVENLMPRAMVLFINAFVWLFLAVLAISFGNRSPVITTAIILSLLCIFIGVRLYHGEHDNQISKV